MRTALDRFRTAYGSHPLHLLTLVAGFALFGYVLATVTPAALWNHRTWWQSILVWFAVAITHCKCGPSSTLDPALSSEQRASRHPSLTLP